MKKLHRQPFFVWPEFLPDAAHLAGCMFALALCVLILPFRAGPIVLAGLAFTLTTYFAQSVIQEEDPAKLAYLMQELYHVLKDNQEEPSLA